MAKFFKWLVFSVLGLVLLVAAVAVLLHRWLQTDDFRLRVENQASAALGVPVQMTGVAVDIWPLPAVALSNITVQSTPPVTIGRVELRPEWQPLLQGRLEVATLIVRRAELPQRGVDALLLLVQRNKGAGAAPPAAAASTPASAPSVEADASRVELVPRRTVLDKVTWISETGRRTSLDGQASLGDDGLPDSVDIRLLEGPLQGLTATLKREGAGAPSTAATAAAAASAPAAGASSPATGPGPITTGERWALTVNVGGGRIEGQLGLERVRAASARPVPAVRIAKNDKNSAGRRRLVSPEPEELVLQGQLRTQGVEVSALTAPSRPLTGLLEATTQLSARAATTGGLVDALRSQTQFTVRNAVLQGLDLARAVQTIGLSRGGQTALDTLTGDVTTQGKAVQVSQLVARSGVLGATGQVAISPEKALGGELVVTVTGDSRIVSYLGGVVAVPLVVGGTLDAPEVTLSRLALVGAAIGTAVMPGVGTGVGAKVGEKLDAGLRGLFGK